ncbi:MAG: alpha/beta fold hydrolase [Promethearchaeota archaeon]
MPKALANNIEIEYDTFGDPSGMPLLLIMGLGTQMIAWMPEFRELLVEKGFYVIRFDNRDVGLSKKFGELGVPEVMGAIKKLQNGEEVNSPYSLEDMADDAMGLLDHLNIKKAHICGASMGSMIAQILAIRYPSRVLSLVPIMGSTGNPDLPQATPEAMQVLMVPMPTKRERYIKESVKRGRILYGKGFPYDEELRAKFAAEAYDRSFYPEGFSRQLMAIMANGDRREKLKSLKVPTLVIHGKDDPLVPMEGGIDISKNIPEAELLLIDGMGHSLPPEVWPQIAEAIKKNAEKAN